MTAVSPAGTEAEAVNVTVTTPLGDAATPADQFTYEGPRPLPPSRPRPGRSAAAPSVTITGTNLTGATR